MDFSTRNWVVFDTSVICTRKRVTYKLKFKKSKLRVPFCDGLNRIVFKTVLLHVKGNLFKVCVFLKHLTHVILKKVFNILP